MLAPTCARALVAPSKDRKVQDFSIESRLAGSRCGYYLSADQYRQPMDAGKPDAHEYIKGLA
jgi:hypothetical protein